jgi:hypothetical protein
VATRPIFCTLLALAAAVVIATPQIGLGTAREC